MLLNFKGHVQLGLLASNVNLCESQPDGNLLLKSQAKIPVRTWRRSLVQRRKLIIRAEKHGP
jgi:hypothetical protein